MALLPILLSAFLAPWSAVFFSAYLDFRRAALLDQLSRPSSAPWYFSRSSKQSTKQLSLPSFKFIHTKKTVPVHGLFGIKRDYRGLGLNFFPNSQLGSTSSFCQEVKSFLST